MVKLPFRDRLCGHFTFLSARIKELVQSQLASLPVRVFESLEDQTTACRAVEEPGRGQPEHASTVQIARTYAVHWLLSPAISMSSAHSPSSSVPGSTSSCHAPWPRWPRSPATRHMHHGHSRRS